MKKRLFRIFLSFFLLMAGGCSAAAEAPQASLSSVPLPAPAALDDSSDSGRTGVTAREPVPIPVSVAAKTTETAEEAGEEAGTARIAFAGDTTQSDVFGEVTDTHGTAYPFEDVAPVFRGADLAFVNLETSVSTRGESEKPEGYGFRTDPAHLEVYREAGIDLVSCANNHTRDYGTEALTDTLFHLGEIGIDQVGAGETLSEAGRLAVYELNGIRVGFTACNMINMNPTWYAGEDHPGIRCVDFADCESYLAEISEYDRLCDVLFVSVHWGIEYVNAITEEQSNFAHLLCDHGADVVLGGHPHVLQPIEAYNGSMIFYSLGNFLFYKMDDEAGKTAVFEIEIDRNGFVGGKISPVFIRYCKSNLLAESDPLYEEILTLVRTISEPYGVSVGGKGEITVLS